MWKKINYLGFQDYSITEDGKLRNDVTGKILKPKIDRYGYLTIGIYNKGIKKYPTIHRLVALTYIPNPENKLQVNHKDGNKLNNAVSNLEWVSNRENIIHALETKLYNNSNTIVLEDLKTTQCKKFRSLKELSKYLNVGTNVLIPYIKHSKTYPFMDRYVITFNNYNDNLWNTLIFGKPLKVYDVVTKQHITYSSINEFNYHTSNKSNRLNKSWLMSNGYLLEEDFDKLDSIDIEEVKINRLKTISSKYTPKNKIFYLYNYYTKEEFKFLSVKDIFTFINKNSLIKNSCTMSALLCSLGSDRHEKTMLINGFGCQGVYEKKRVWYPYTEEVIISSMYKKPAPMKCYRVNGKVIVGMYNVLKYLNLNISKKINNITIEDILKLKPECCIERLNKPLLKI